MAMTMKEKGSLSHVKTEWPAALKAEFAHEAERPNGCVGSELLSETEKTRVWIIRLTTQGKRVAERAKVSPWEILRGALAALPSADQDRLTSILKKLVNNVTAQVDQLVADERCDLGYCKDEDEIPEEFNRARSSFVQRSSAVPS